jgi:hypothetical protein
VREAVEIDKAEAVILGCTIEFGFYAQLQREFGVPIVDAVYACYKATEAAALAKVQFGWKPAGVTAWPRRRSAGGQRPVRAAADRQHRDRAPRLTAPHFP